MQKIITWLQEDNISYAQMRLFETIHMLQLNSNAKNNHLIIRRATGSGGANGEHPGAIAMKSRSSLQGEQSNTRTCISSERRAINPNQSWRFLLLSEAIGWEGHGRWRWDQVGDERRESVWFLRELLSGVSCQPLVLFTRLNITDWCAWAHRQPILVFSFR